jgi:A/G-specific adenine glycosylase
VTDSRFSTLLLSWHAQHGRHDLPWQQDKSAYRVWVSEIMLQQTQVTTVIPYFERFMQRFPDVQTLADAAEDEVLHHWTGLGYYARARNLHRTARIVRGDYAGEFPRDAAALSSLPGIGRSTAGAICAIAYNHRSAILDGNVKRVLSRFHAIDTTARPAEALKQLWEIAEAQTPNDSCDAYTQAIMDLGATVCTRSRPACALCPLANDCRARAEGHPERFPGRKATRAVPVRQCQLLVIRNKAGDYLLEKRPPTGIWGGLWSFPQIDHDEDAVMMCDRIVGSAPDSVQRGATFRHTFSHFHLDATPVFLEVHGSAPHISDDSRLLWYRLGARELGFAAPVKRLLDALSSTSTRTAEMF